MVYDAMPEQLVTIDDLYKFTSRDRVQIECSKCESIFSRTVHSVRVNVNRNGLFICHKCRINAPDYIAAQKKSHPKTGSKWDTLVRVSCCICSKESDIRYRSLQHLNRSGKEHRCLSCVNTKTHADGKYKQMYTEEFLERLNDAGDNFWSENRDVWKTEYMGHLLNDPAYHALMSEYGQKPWKDPEYRKRMIQSNKNLWDSTEFREKMADVRCQQSGNISSIQLKLYEYLDDLNVSYYREGQDTKIGYYVFDCLINNQDGRDLLIECQGDYWHSSEKVQARDRGKFTSIDRYFPEYEVMYIWEHEFSTKDRVLQRLQSKLGIEITSVDFDIKDIELKSVSSGDIKSFLDAYHYIGKGRGGKCFGAFLSNELIGCIVFSPPIRQNVSGQFDGDVVELSRLCIHPSYHKKNFASWLVGRSIRRVDSDIIIAYSDATVGHDGTTYRAANFKLHHEVAPDYWYVDTDGFVMHKKTLYQRARKMSMKEREFAEKYNYVKKWGGKKLCFIYNKK